MKIPKPILLYLLTLEMLPLLDNLNVSASHKKASRTIETFANETFETIETHKKLSSIVNDEMVQQFSKLVDDLKYSDEILLYCITKYIKELLSELKASNSIIKAIWSVLDFAFIRYVESRSEMLLSDCGIEFDKTIDSIEVVEHKNN